MMLGVLAIYVIVTFALKMPGCPRYVESFSFVLKCLFRLFFFHFNIKRKCINLVIATECQHS